MTNFEYIPGCLLLKVFSLQLLALPLPRAPWHGPPVQQQSTVKIILAILYNAQINIWSTMGGPEGWDKNAKYGD